MFGIASARPDCSVHAVGPNLPGRVRPGRDLSTILCTAGSLHPEHAASVELLVVWSVVYRFNPLAKKVRTEFVFRNRIGEQKGREKGGSPIGISGEHSGLPRSGVRGPTDLIPVQLIRR